MSETVETVESVAPEPVATEPDAPRDLRSVLAAAFDEVSTREEGEEAPETPEGPQRDERGRFTSANPDEPPVEQEAKPDGQEAPEEARPALPEPRPVDQVLERYKPLYAARGIAPEHALSSLFEAQKILEERPREAIQVLARQYGVDLTQFAPQAPAQPQAPTTNDPVSAMQRELAELKQFLSSQQQKAQEAEATAVEQSIQQFASDPKHAHFPTVRTAMGALMQAGIAKDMSAAYEMACRAHPEVWKAIQSAEAEAKAKADAAERAKAAAAARAKAVSVRGAVPTPGSTPAPKSLRGMIEAAWDGRLN